MEVLLRAHRPHEILHEHGRLSPSIKTWLRHAAPLAVFSQQQRGELDGEMWRAETTLFRLGDYLGDLQVGPRLSKGLGCRVGVLRTWDVGLGCGSKGWWVYLQVTRHTFVRHACRFRGGWLRI